MKITLEGRAIRARWDRLRVREDFLTGSIMGSAVAIFFWTSSHTMGPTVDRLIHGGSGPQTHDTVALLLNAALILFAWSRHKDAQKARRARTAAEQREHLLRTRDSDTDLLNRSSLRERTGALIERARESRGSVALMVISLHRFKKINDTYGEAVGDGLLRIIAGLICGIVPRGALCARLGSDEFAIALPFENGEDGKVMDVAADLLAQLDLPIEVMGATLKVSGSIGLSQLGFDCTDFTALLRRADVAMNAARERSGACPGPLWFDASMERVLRARSEVEAGLQRGIAGGEFVPYFQPLVSFATGRIEGFEMLARWHPPAGGVVGPEVFIPVAEEIGAIGELSEALMRVAFLEAKHWDASLILAVNISPLQLSDPWFPQKVVKLLAETGFPARRLEIEITESSLFKDLETAQTAAESLKEQGIRLSLDDFGTGYSSLAHLRSLPFDRIKVDRSFLLSLNKDPESWTIAQSIAGLGKSLGIPVTLEGVESAAIELRARQLGCEMGQGWFYGRAVPAAQVRRLLADDGLLAGNASEGGEGGSPAARAA